MTEAGFADDALLGRVAIVTGAASGIGRATATVLAGLGAAVAVVDVDAAGAGDVVAGITAGGGRATAVGCDLGRVRELDAVVARVEATLGRPTILVNNAGIVGATLLETDLDAWEQVLAVNLTAPFALLRAVGRRMVAGGTGGSIVNLSSSSAFRAVSSGGAYGVSKAGLGGLTRGGAWELGPYGVNVNTVAPGVTRTPITARAFGDAAGLDAAVATGPLANLLGRVSEPEDVANVIAFLCLPASRQITGQVVHVSAGAVVAAG
jgi:NAD(P)-dependent dehydrogenase (short-subunit alcohol dehydrogenase family)